MIYREYCNNFYKGDTLIKALRKNKPKEFEKIEGKLAMDIESYLIKPIQRPPKYQLLLREYQKCLIKTHPDY